MKITAAIKTLPPPPTTTTLTAKVKTIPSLATATKATSQKIPTPTTATKNNKQILMTQECQKSLPNDFRIIVITTLSSLVSVLLLPT